MKRALLIALTVVLTLGAVERAAAQKFELGARAGVASQNMNMEFAGLDDARARLGWHAAVVSRMRIIGFGDGLLGAGLFFQPEVVYTQNSFKMKGHIPPRSDEIVAYDSKFRMQTVDIPLMLSLKVSLVRVQAGPVVNLMNNFTSMSGDMELLPNRAPVGFAAGVSVDLGPLVIDGRYHGEFNKVDFKGDWGDFKSSLSSWSVGVGLMF